MKKYFFILVAAATLFSTKTFAQAKLGHINSSDLVQLMPGLKDANTQLETYQKSLEDQLKSMYTEYQTKSQDYDSKKNLMADAVREVKEKELAQMEKNIQDFQQSAQEKISAKKEELYSPILKKAEQAIKDVAKENNYTYIFDTSAGSVIYSVDSNDIMDLVKKKLNIVTLPPAPVPAPGSGMTPIPQAPKK